MVYFSSKTFDEYLSGTQLWQIALEQVRFFHASSLSSSLVQNPSKFDHLLNNVRERIEDAFDILQRSQIYGNYSGALPHQELDQQVRQRNLTRSNATCDTRCAWIKILTCFLTKAIHNTR